MRQQNMEENLIQQIIEWHRQVNRIVRNRAVTSWVDLSLTIPQVKSLFFISRAGKVKISGLASGIKVTPGNMTGIVDRLLKQKLITRKPDSNDRRILWLAVTERGQRLVDELREGRATEIAKILGKLSQEELSVVARGYELMAGAAQNYQEEMVGKDD